MAAAPKKSVDTSTYAGRFAERLRILREKAGLSVEEFATKITTGGYELSAKSVYNWEGGLREPPFNCLPFIATALGLKTVRVLMPEK